MRALLILTLALPALAGTPEPVTLLDRGYSEMYNLLFDQAHRSFQEWTLEHPDDPMGPVSDAAAWLFAEFDRLHILQSEFFVHDDSFRADAATPDPVAKRRFEEALERSRVLSDRILARSPKDANALFAALLQRGLKADYLGLIEHRYFGALSEIKAGRTLAQRLLAVDPKCYDAYLALGVENYMLSLKPAPVRWFLRIGGAQTDRETGLRQLKITADGGRYLMPYARLLLAVAALRDHDHRRATELLEYLASSFPRNPLYAKELARLRSGRG
jgi:hypothetical protein